MASRSVAASRGRAASSAGSRVWAAANRASPGDGRTDGGSMTAGTGRRARASGAGRASSMGFLRAEEVSAGAEPVLPRRPLVCPRPASLTPPEAGHGGDIGRQARPGDAFRKSGRAPGGSAEAPAFGRERDCVHIQRLVDGFVRGLVLVFLAESRASGRGRASIAVSSVTRVRNKAVRIGGDCCPKPSLCRRAWRRAQSSSGNITVATGSPLSPAPMATMGQCRRGGRSLSQRFLRISRTRTHIRTRSLSALWRA